MAGRHVFRLRRSAEWTPWPYPHGGFFAACHGVLTSHALPRSSWGPSLRAIASLLQAKHMPLRWMSANLAGSRLVSHTQRGDGRAKAERLTSCVKNLFFPAHFLRKERRSSAARLALSSGCLKREKIDSAGGHRAALPGHPRPCYLRCQFSIHASTPCYPDVRITSPSCYLRCAMCVLI